MSSVIAITNQKGGVGKTTTAINLASALREKGYKAHVADMNSQQRSAFKWSRRGEELSPFVSQLSDKKPREQIEELKTQNNFVFIDTAPELMTPSLKAALLSSLVIIPCSPSPLDLESAEDTIDLIEETNKPYVMLASCVRSGTNLGAQLRETLQKIGTTFNTVIHQRIDIVEAAILGQWVGSYKKDSKSHEEYQSLADELIKIIGLKK